MIITSKCFDYGTACVSEQAIVADPEIARDLRHEMKMRGAYFCSPAEADRLAKVIFVVLKRWIQSCGAKPDGLGWQAAGISIPPRTRCLVSEESEMRWHRPLSTRKAEPRSGVLRSQEQRSWHRNRT